VHVTPCASPGLGSGNRGDKCLDTTAVGRREFARVLVRLHRVAIPYGDIQSDMAVTGGVHTGEDAFKAMPPSSAQTP
jgi:hypothetical protein